MRNLIKLSDGSYAYSLQSSKWGIRFYTELWQVGLCVKLFTAFSGARVVQVRLPLLTVEVLHW